MVMLCLIDGGYSLVEAGMEMGAVSEAGLDWCSACVGLCGGQGCVFGRSTLADGFQMEWEFGDVSLDAGVAMEGLSCKGIWVFDQFGPGSAVCYHVELLS